MKLERIDLRVSKEEKDFYKREADKRGIKLSELIRQALENEINKENNK
ncbi:DUF6290 family protein [Clostridium sp.]|nr:DUF6290 family protein [Clostridium sp.]MBS5985258.1 hypothetical protein [Clostridium sp.]